ncbi:hypothetical protein MVES1_001204 [Malassezia vespertilionis]|uniref:Small ribosomal subunit protein bS18m n=1 Tax=Malassezia vespertilionis TaxID=2020962 RepID=A0A2N1JEU2_9BASI|nr:uncharacterized protein MVES1_001204 [Malassezia vespertilionis]PKI85077.1 hypothetical protein MVES_001135 [Malassezia vespertilionis]WFD05870.1 hypothetical protein MVES1_001204 [Malassezia vespertilionis]
MLRGAWSLLPSVREGMRVSVRVPGMQVRMKSTEKGKEEKEATRDSTQQRLDQLASFLESQPKERPARAPRTAGYQRSQNNTTQKGVQAMAGARRTEQLGPTKTFQNGQYYDPYTLEPTNLTMQRRRRALPLLGPTKREAMKQDPLHILGLNPAKPSLADDTYKNGALLAEFTSEMGRILPRNISGLTRKSQRYIGKAIRRARALGILPVMSRGHGPKGSGGWR